MNLPKARTDNIVVQNLNDETLIYDLKINRAFCLNETAARVFAACGDEGSFEQLKEKYQFTDEIIYLALDTLKKENLLADDSYIYAAGGNESARGDSQSRTGFDDRSAGDFRAGCASGFAGAFCLCRQRHSSFRSSGSRGT